MASPPRVDYERLSSYYDRYRDLDAGTLEVWIRNIREMGGLARGRRVLDVGCGTGRLAIPLRARGLVVVGLDVSTGMLRQARAKERHLSLVRASAQALPFRPQAFHTALAAYLLHQLKDWRGALAEMARAARNVVVVTTEIQSDGGDILYEAFPSVLAIDARRFPTVPALVEAMGSVGLRDAEVRRTGYARRRSPGEFLQAVRDRYISTLTLIPEAEFQAGLRFLERELPRRFPDRVERSTAVAFISAHP